jgi:hypothetical protein
MWEMKYCLESGSRNEISKRKANWSGHFLRRNSLLQRVIEGKIQGGIEVTGRQGRRHRKLLDDLNERRGYYYLKEEALDRTMWRARFGRGFGPVVRQTTEWLNKFLKWNYIFRTEELSETFRVSFHEQIWEISASSWFYYKKNPQCF